VKAKAVTVGKNLRNVMTETGRSTAEVAMGPHSVPGQPAATRIPSDRRSTLLICLFLALATASAFWRVPHLGFVTLDDDVYVTANTHVRGGLTLEDLRWAFTSVGYAGYWHPVTWISHMLDVQLFGMRPGPAHVVNLLLHVANTILLYLVLFRMTKARWRSAFVAALFAWHPLRVESVAWVAERKDVLSTFFWMLTIGAYLRYLERPTLGRYLLIFLALALGIMAKPMLVTVPFTFLLLDYWPLCRFDPVGARAETTALQRDREEKKPRKRRTASSTEGVLRAEESALQPYQWKSIIPLLAEKLPLFALAALSTVIMFVTQQRAEAVVSILTVPLGGRVATALIAYCAYIRDMFWPAHLMALYPHPGSWPLSATIPAALVLAAITAVVVRAARRFPYLLSGWLWYAGTLVPVVGIVQIGPQARADRFTYMPLVGLFIIVAWGVNDLSKKWPYRRHVLAAASAVVLSCLFVATVIQVGYWRDSMTLYNRALSIAPANPLILNNRGALYSDLHAYSQALADFNESIALVPDFKVPYVNRSFVWNALGNYQQALADANRGIGIDPRNKLAYCNRGFIYDTLHDYTQGIRDFDKAIELDPGYADAYRNRGFAYGALGDYAQAMKDVEKGFELDPGNPDNYNKRGTLYAATRNFTRAVQDFDKMIEIAPGSAVGYYNRALVYSTTQDFARAIADFGRAAQADPRYVNAYVGRGEAYMALHDYARAVNDFSQAVAIAPQYADAYYELGVASERAGDTAQALAAFRQAAMLGSEAAKKALSAQAQER
jgi:protein O-mannosyl-transferase